MADISPDLLAALHTLLAQALDLAPAEREAWLARLRLEQPDLADELERLLDAEAVLDARHFLSDRLAGAPSLEGGTLAGMRLGAWTLEQPLGRGGMGTVWLARRSDGRFEGRAAVKLLNLALLDPVGAERFRREGTVLARVAHPLIARLLDAGVTEGGQPYLVLEHVEGEWIDRYCDRQRLAPEQRIRLFLDVLAAVAHAHTNLVVHRDLKPSNILVTPAGAVKLLDFGIAKLLEADTGTTERSMLTDLGGLALTPEYAAPEQVLGGMVTTSTDVYALGVLLYHLLAGRHPTGEGCHSAAEHLRAVTDTEPRRLSLAVAAPGAGEHGAREAVATARGSTPERLRRLYLGDLDNIVAKAIRKDPAARYPSVAAFADDLRRYLRHETVGARPDSLWYRSSKFARRNRVALAAGTVLAVGLVAAAARERQLRARAEAEAQTAVAVEQYLVTVFGAADPFAPQDSSAAEITARELLERGAGRIDTALEGQSEVRVRLRRALGQVYLNLGLADKAASQIEGALTEHRSLGRQADRDEAALMDQLGVVRERQGNIAAADSLMTDALALRRTLHGDDDSATAESLDHLAGVRRERNDFASAEGLAREALAIRQAVYGDSALPTADSKQSLAQLLTDRGGDKDTAARLYREALAVRERRLGESHPVTAETMRNLALAERRRGNIAAAESLYRRALAAQRRALGETHPMVAATLDGLADLLQKSTPRSEEAESLLRQALAINRRMLGENHAAVSTNLGNLAVIVRERGDFAEAERLLRRALAIDRAVFGAEHMYVGYDLNELAAVLRLRGMPDSALPILRVVLAQSRRIAGDDHRNTVAVKIHLGRALRESGHLPEAVAMFREGLRPLDPANPDTYPFTAMAEVGLGRALVGLGRPGEALPILERAAEASERNLGSANWRTAEARLGLGECLIALGRTEEAARALRAAQTLLEPQRRAQPLLLADLERNLRQLERVGGRTAQAPGR